MIVELNADCYAYAEDFAKRRMQMGSRPVHGYANEYPDVIGAVGELVVRAALDMPLTLELLPTTRDPGWDIEVAGVTIDVKTSRHLTAKLAIDTCHGQRLKATCAALVVPAGWPGAFRIAGVIGQARFYKVAKPDDLGYGPCLTVPQVDLLPMSDFLHWLRFERGID